MGFVSEAERKKNSQLGTEHGCAFGHQLLRLLTNPEVLKQERRECPKAHGF